MVQLSVIFPLVIAISSFTAALPVTRSDDDALAARGPDLLKKALGVVKGEELHKDRKGNAIGTKRMKLVSPSSSHGGSSRVSGSQNGSAPPSTYAGSTSQGGRAPSSYAGSASQSGGAPSSFAGSASHASSRASSFISQGGGRLPSVTPDGNPIVNAHYPSGSSRRKGGSKVGSAGGSSLYSGTTIRPASRVSSSRGGGGSSVASSSRGGAPSTVHPGSSVSQKDEYGRKHRH